LQINWRQEINPTPDVEGNGVPDPKGSLPAPLSGCSAQSLALHQSCPERRWFPQRKWSLRWFRGQARPGSKVYDVR